MNDLTIWIIVFIVLFIVLFKLWRPKSRDKKVADVAQSNDEVKSIPGAVNVNLGDASQLDLSLALDGFSQFQQINNVIHSSIEQVAQLNRYCFYRCTHETEQNSSNPRKVILNLKLNDQKITFHNVYNICLKQTNETIEIVEFEQRWSQADRSLEQAFQDYKRFMQELLDYGCQNYFGLEDVRYRKDEYHKILKSGDHTCLAPDLIQFDEFKAVLESEDFLSLDSYFYLGDFEISICYNYDYSATFEIRYLASIYSALSSFGADDLYLDELSINEKQIKLENYRKECLQARREEEEEIKQAGFGIDENYKDPLIQFKI